MLSAGRAGQSDRLASGDQAESPGTLSGQKAGSGLDAEMAREICDSNSRLLDAWQTPVDMVLWEMMEDMFLGHVMAEIVADDVDGGPDDGMLAIKAVRPNCARPISSGWTVPST